ncbi:MAG: 30S ribosomal protein S3 [Treponema sp.]|jgi:small subunit ribosomal protein S3|nr:30S ribosomal protein S3 [Treponema sp.]
MGQKVNPIGLRVGINKTWGSRWYVDPREYAATLHEDLKLRKTLMGMSECKGADIAEVEIIRHPQRITIVIHTARPGVIIGVKGANIEKIGAELQKSIQPLPGRKEQVSPKKVQIKIKEVRNADSNAQIVAQNIARQLLARGSFRRTMKQAISNAIKKGNAQGIKVRLSGRLGGAEMSRTEESKEGRIPLHTLRADIDYGFAEAHTTFGAIGVKVWVYNGMKYGKEQKEDAGALVRKRRERTPVRS